MPGTLEELAVYIKRLRALVQVATELAKAGRGGEPIGSNIDSVARSALNPEVRRDS